METQSSLFDSCAMGTPTLI